MNMDWGSAVFDPRRDLIVRFSGGHSAYSGTAPQVYDVKTDRYSIPFAPEYPLEYVYSNDQVRGEWSFRGNPWMTGHTYKSTGYDPNLKAFVFAPHEYTYFFDPDTGNVDAVAGEEPVSAEFLHRDGLRDSGRGGRLGGLSPREQRRAVAAERRIPNLEAVAAQGRDCRRRAADRHGMALDTKRGRLLLFSDAGPKKGNVAAYDLKSGESRWLNPAGADKALVHCRETVYLADADLVLIGGRVKDDAGGWRWLAYDCAANAWVSIALAGDDPWGRPGRSTTRWG